MERFFDVTVDGVEIPQVIAVAGLDLDEPCEQDAGGEEQHGLARLAADALHHHKEASKRGEATITCVVTEDRTMDDWFRAIREEGMGASRLSGRRTVRVSITDDRGAPVASVALHNAWVAACRFGEVNPDSNAPITVSYAVEFDALQRLR